MIRITFALLALGFCSTSFAAMETLADVKANGGVELSAADLKELMPGAKVISRTQAGSTRTWQNKLDGTLSASSDGRGVTGGKNGYATGGARGKSPTTAAGASRSIGRTSPMTGAASCSRSEASITVSGNSKTLRQTMEFEISK